MTRGLEITPGKAQSLMGALTALVARAAAATLATSFSEVERRTKDDQSPVTVADEAAEAIIIEGVNALLPGVAIVAEESIARAGALTLEPSFVIVDPLDGTKEFLAGRDEFTVNLGIVTHGIPVAGIIAAPKQGWLWRGVVGAGAETLKLHLGDGHADASGGVAIHARRAPARIRAATSRSHLDKSTEEFLARQPVGERYGCGSSVKFCHLAEGSADLYPRLAPTREWDIAAGQAILLAAGGTMFDPNGGALKYGNRDNGFLVPGFIACGDPAFAARLKL